MLNPTGRIGSRLTVKIEGHYNHARSIMLTNYHEDITRQALSYHFSPEALQVIVRANLAQDELRGQFGHDEFHFDNNAFALSNAYIEAQRDQIHSALSDGDAHTTWAAFGRLTHTSQDLYAHSNYVDLWLSRFGGDSSAAADIEPMVAELLCSPDLRSGKLYYPFEILSFVPVLKLIIIPFLPRDSHAWMNLDGPTQGWKFPYAFEAARKRTHYEYERTVADLSQTQVALFSGLITAG
jgi:hypothetical protein